MKNGQEKEREKMVKKVWMRKREENRKNAEEGDTRGRRRRRTR